MRPLATTILNGVGTRLSALAAEPGDEFTAFELQVLGLGAFVLASDAERGPAVRAEEHRDLADLLRRARRLGLEVAVDEQRLEDDLAPLPQTVADRRLAEVQEAVIGLHEELEATAHTDADRTALLDAVWATLARCNARRRGVAPS